MAKLSEEKSQVRVRKRKLPEKGYNRNRMEKKNKNKRESRKITAFGHGIATDW